jgi:hypothetical protein
VVLETGSRDWISRSDLERWLTVRASSSGIITGAYHSEIGTFTVIQPVGIALGDQSWQWYILGLGDRRQGLWSQPADFGVFARLRARRTRDGEVVHREFTVGTQSRLWTLQGSGEILREAIREAIREVIREVIREAIREVITCSSWRECSLDPSSHQGGHQGGN